MHEAENREGGENINKKERRTFIIKLSKKIDTASIAVVDLNFTLSTEAANGKGTANTKEPSAVETIFVNRGTLSKKHEGTQGIGKKRRMIKQASGPIKRPYYGDWGRVRAPRNSTGGEKRNSKLFVVKR